MNLGSFTRLAVAALALAWSSGAAPARASGSDTGLSTGESHMVTVSANPTAGVEANMPRDGAYARAIELDSKMRWDDSYTAYSQAIGEFRKMISKRPRWKKMIELWIEKAEYMRSQSSRLRTSRYYRRYYYRYRYRNPSYRWRRAEAMHNKWLAIRAFTGRAPRALLDKVIADYTFVLGRTTSYPQAQLSLAALYHEVGQHDKGQRLFKKLPKAQYRHSWRASYVAYYYAAAGNARMALKYLRKAMTYSRSSTQRVMRQSNDFDRLRSHPEFRRLLGEK
ncbi:MAG: hypothetical protein KC503_09880 [Myxococcales bacterium]|nr:hypothetical protein [Myxococcales bacterium]